MSPQFLLLLFGLAHSSALLSKNLQSIVNEKLMPSHLVKMKAVDPNWRGEGIFKRITNDAGLFAHRETNEIILETKEKLWTESEIIDELEYESDEFKNLIVTKDWSRLLARGYWAMAKDQFRNYWSEALVEIVYMNGTILIRAVMCDGLNIVKILLKRHANVNAKDQYGWTALHYAAYSGRIEAMKLLLEFEVEVNATTNLEETPLMIAVKYNETDAVKVLLERDTRLDLRNNDEKTALDIAKIDRNETIIELLEIKQNQIRSEKVI